MQANQAFWTGLGLGVAAMFLIDPGQGRRRRARVRDAAMRGLRKTSDAAGATARDLRQRAQGLAATARARRQHEPVPDHILVERVRSKLGRYVSHPRAIDVEVTAGDVRLTGPVLAHERSRAVSALRRLPGVRAVHDHLDPHVRAGRVPGLQGGRPRPGEPFELWQRQWPPAIRLLAGVSGAVVATYGASRHDAAGAALTLAGLGLAARGATNLETSRLIGVGAGRRAIDVHKTIDIAAPVDEVFETWRQFEHFPRFTSCVREVRLTPGEGRSHWTVAGPGGVPIDFDAVVTDLVPNERIVWKTVGRGAVRHAGGIRFAPGHEGGTRVQIRMSYNPPAGALGHAAARALGQDLESLLHGELLRIKTFIETGRTPHDAAARSESLFT